MTGLTDPREPHRHAGGRELGRVLVTGAGGFLGSALVAELWALGADVVATDIGPVAATVGGMIPCEVTDFDRVDAVVKEGAFATILHCGAVSGPMVMPDRPLDIWRINADGMTNVLEAARRHAVPRIVTCSTSEVYGDRSGRVDETSRPHTASVYGASKLAGEEAMLGYAREHGVDAMALRLSWIYGPGRQTPTTLDALLRATIAGRDTTLPMPADAYTHYLHIDDAVQGVMCAATAADTGSRIFNITTGPGVPMADVAETVMGLYPGVQVKCGAPDPAGRGIAEIDNSLAAREIGFAPRIALVDGLKRLCAALEDTARQ